MFANDQVTDMLDTEDSLKRKQLTEIYDFYISVCRTKTMDSVAVAFLSRTNEHTTN